MTSSQNETEQLYRRFSVYERIEHWIFITSFIALGVTGLIQKFSLSPISQAIVSILGGITTVRMIHHFAAIIMLFVSVYHMGAVGYRWYVQRKRMTMLPAMSDARNLYSAFLFYIGQKKHAPQQDRYTFEEKMEYWAVVWGTIVMALTGLIMWNPVFVSSIMTGEIIPAAKAAHGLEAILAVVSIFLWHFYHIFVKTFNKSMYNGHLTEEQMLEEHPLELADIKAGANVVLQDAGKMRQRRNRYLIIYSIIGGILGIGVLFLVTFENTVPVAFAGPVSTPVAIFVPLTPTPFPTQQPTKAPPSTTAATWDGGIGDMFQTDCSACHNSVSLVGGLDLTRYSTALEGGNSGAGIVPGDPDTSQVVIIQSPGAHPGQFTPEELQVIIDWIKNQAPEK